MSGVQMSDFISKIGHLDPRFYSLIYCDTGGPDVGGPDVGGPYVRFPQEYICVIFVPNLPLKTILCLSVSLQMKRKKSESS